MPAGLKMSVATGDSRPQGKAVRNALYWFYLRIRYWKLKEDLLPEPKEFE